MKPRGNLAILINVHFGKHYRAMLFGKLVDKWIHTDARSAPRSPEIYKDFLSGFNKTIKITSADF